MKKLITSLAILIPLLLTACKEAEKKAPVKLDYDFRDEQYQDFYSRFKRQVSISKGNYQNDIVHGFNAGNIEDMLGIAHIPESALGMIVIARVEPIDNKIRIQNHFSSKEDIIDYYTNHKRLKDLNPRSCNVSDERGNFICIHTEPLGEEYFFIPDYSKDMEYINQSISVDCEPIISTKDEQYCMLRSYTDKPYNIDIWAKFHNLDNFYYVAPYIEKLIFNATGEHIWQTSPQAKGVNHEKTHNKPSSFNTAIADSLQRS